MGTLREFPVWDKVEKWIEDEFGDQFSGKQKGNIQDLKTISFARFSNQ